eukprot:COSAG05_NODE_1977_length_3759_cov_6.284973_3_plen_316_part_00
MAALLGRDSRASTTVAEGVPPERRAQDQSEPEPEDELPTRSSESPVNRSVSLQWLNDFVAQNCGTRFSFERREFMAPEDGGGNQSGIDITAETLDAHRSARRAAETAGTGQPVTVRYVGIMFETMTTADVMEAIIRPVARVQHKSYAEAAIPLQSTDSPTYFVSHAWDSLFMDLVDGLGAYLEGAAQAETFPWLDIFAINQDDTGGQFSASAQQAGHAPATGTMSALSATTTAPLLGCKLVVHLALLLRHALVLFACSSSGSVFEFVAADDPRIWKPVPAAFCSASFIDKDGKIGENGQRGQQVTHTCACGKLLW